MKKKSFPSLENFTQETSQEDDEVCKTGRKETQQKKKEFGPPVLGSNYFKIIPNAACARVSNPKRVQT